MKRFDLAGRLMNRDTALADFVIHDGVATSFTLLCDDDRYLPYEMIDQPTGSNLVQALLERVVPETRQGLMGELASVGIHGYDLSAILRYQNASSLEDPFWVKFEEGPQTWAELRQDLGYAVLCSECGALIDHDDPIYLSYSGDPLCRRCMVADESSMICPQCGRKVPNRYMAGSFCIDCEKALL